MIFCVFSFNRGRFLENCIRSIEQCAPSASIVVFDDGSDDPETVGILEAIRAQHTVIVPKHTMSGHHLGGLYGNMQSALEYCAEEETVCFLQDDTQVVRPILEKEFAEIEKIFRQLPELGFIHPCFIKALTLAGGAIYSHDAQHKLYFRKPDARSAGRHFSALLIMKPARLLEAGWVFAGSEPKNNARASNLFMPMGYLQTPFAMWLPQVPAYRGKKKTLGLKLAEKKRQCGFYPFEIMTQEEVDALYERDPSVLPCAEEYLRCEPYDPPRPWVYNPLTNAGWLKLLNQIEVKLRKYLGF